MGFSIFLVLALTFLLNGCEEPFEPDYLEDRNEVVVEAYLEWNSEANIPPFVILSKSFPFTQEIDPAFISDLYIKDAFVSVNDGINELELQRFCTDDLPPALLEEIKRMMGRDSLFSNFCLFTDLSGELIIEAERTYELKIETEGRSFHSVNTIPRPVPLDSLWVTDVPDPDADSLVQLVIRLTDPPGPDFYRYFTAVNGGPLLAPRASVTDDELIDGKSFEISILKAEPRGTDFDPETFGYFERGDSVLLKWCTLSRGNFEFWETLEFSRNNQGPFSGYTLVKSNIEGEDALGVFGAQSCFLYRIEIPE